MRYLRDPSTAKFGLVLTGGGARAAYQVGVLRAISAITKYETNPFRVISGYSAGAINGTWLAGRTENFALAATSMWEEWDKITSDRIFDTEMSTVISLGLRWIKDRTIGGLHHNRQQISYLLDTAPLQKFIQSKINYSSLRNHLASGAMYGISVTAANYHTGQSVTFYSGSSEIQDWQRLNRISVRTHLEAAHVIASSSIPIFFPPVKIGGAYFGDGMIRLNSPLSAAIKMGAERVLVIGIRGPSSVTTVNPAETDHVTLGEIAGTILNGLFFDSLDSDLARMARINRTLSLMNPEQRERQTDFLREVPMLALRPTTEVGHLSSCQLSRVPGTLRFLLKGIGLKEDRGTDLLSYLSFDPKYLHSLLEAGYEDTKQRRDEILDFFS